MSADSPSPSQHTDGSAPPGQTLAETLARPEGNTPAFGTLAAAFASPEHPNELGVFARYRVLKKLGQGGMGAVFLGYDSALERKVALKVMLPQFAADADSRERFLREARSAAKVKSDHVVVIYEVGQERGVPFIAMEYLLGAPLDQYLQHRGELPLPHALRVCREVAHGLAAVHELGLVHRDIKPGNVWLESPKGRAKLLDFGLARAEQDDVNLTGTGAVVGTVAYMSPEQGRGDKVDHRSDLFSLGVMLYRLCTAHMPFTGNSAMAVLTNLAVTTPIAPRAHNPQLSESLESVITKMLAKNPDERYQTATEVADVLLAVGHAAVAGVIPVVAVPLTVGAQTQNVWDGIADSGSIAVPLTEGATERVEPNSTREKFVREKPERAKPSTWPIFAAGASFVLACAVLAAVLLWPKGKPEVAQNEPDKPNTPEKKNTPKANPNVERRVAEWALGIGGFVDVAIGAQKRLLRKGDLVPTETFTIDGINLAGLKQVSDEDLTVFQYLKTLAELDLSGTGVTDAGMAQVGRCTNLRFLSLARTNVHDAGIAELKSCKNLVFLDLDSTTRKVTIAAFHSLSNCDKLEVLDIRRADLGIHGQAEVRRARPNLIVNPHAHAAKLIIALNGEVRFAGISKPVTAATDIPTHGVPITHAMLDTTGKPREQVAAALAALGVCKELESLALTGSNVIDGDLANFKWCHELKQLTLNETLVGDTGLALLRNCTRLETLRLQNTKTGDAGLAQFAFGPLVLLDIRGTAVTRVKMVELQKALPKCKIDWDEPKTPSDPDRATAIAVISLGGKAEMIFDANASREPGPGGLPKGPFQLKGVYSQSAPLTDETLSRFVGCKSMVWANLSDTKVTDAGLLYLKEVKTLNGILLANTKVTDAGLAHLKNIPNLQTLSLDGTAISDAGLDTLKECKSLTSLGLINTKVSRAKVAELQKALPNCKIAWNDPSNK